jgi:hypothetical protein
VHKRGISCTGERSPIFSGKNIEQEIGYIEGDRAFDLFDRPRATYDGDTRLLRNPNTQAIVGYITLKSTFVGSSRIAEKLFAEPGSLLRENEEHDASNVDDSCSNFESPVSPARQRLLTRKCSLKLAIPLLLRRDLSNGRSVNAL